MRPPEFGVEVSGRLPAPPRSLLLADLLVASVSQWWRLRDRGATPSGAIDSSDAAWMIVGRGSSEP
jgi:hypothetical protein